MCELNSDQLIFCAIEEYNQKMLSSLPSVDELDGITVSRKFKKRMQRLIKQRSRFYYPIINTTIKRVACFVLISIAVLSTVTAHSKSVRKFFTNFFADRVSEHSSNIYISGDTSNSPKEIVPNLPKYVPDGFEIVHNIPDILHLNVCYTNKKTNKYIEFRQCIKIQDSYFMTGQNAVEEIKINNSDTLLITNKDYYTILYLTDDYEYILTSNIPKEELLRVVESIQ